MRRLDRSFIISQTLNECLVEAHYLNGAIKYDLSALKSKVARHPSPLTKSKKRGKIKNLEATLTLYSLPG